MDGQRFDDVTRLLGRGASRRSVVKGVFAGIAGTVGIRSGIALAGDPSCAALNESCAFIACCDGHICGKGSVCLTNCSDIGGSCESDDDCCSGACSADSGSCVTPCNGGGVGCDGGGSCCTGICEGGFCTAVCQAEGATCESDDDCCSGACNDGVCAEACQAEGATCESDDDCCSGACNGGACAAVSAAGNAAVTIHVATCPTGVGPGIFDQCHGNVVSGVTFTVTDSGEVQPQSVNASTSGSDGIAGPVDVAAGGVDVAADATTLGNYLTSYVYCSEQNTGTVLLDTDVPGGAIALSVADGDDVICDWYLITEAAAEPTATATSSSSVTSLPATGTTGPEGGVNGGLLGVAAVGGAAALLAARKLRQQPQNDVE